MSFKEPSENQECGENQSLSVSRRIVFVMVGCLLMVSGLTTGLVRALINNLEWSSFYDNVDVAHAMIIAVPHLVLGNPA